jgi:hypothetical protein
MLIDVTYLVLRGTILSDRSAVAVLFNMHFYCLEFYLMLNYLVLESSLYGAHGFIFYRSYGHCWNS